MSLNPRLALAELHVLRGILLKERALAVQEARLKLEERRAELAERALKKMEEPESKLSYEEQSAKLREMFGMACANTGRPPKNQSDSAAETMKRRSTESEVLPSYTSSSLKAGSPDPAVPPSHHSSNQTELPTEP